MQFSWLNGIVVTDFQSRSEYANDSSSLIIVAARGISHGGNAARGWANTILVMCETFRPNYTGYLFYFFARFYFSSVSNSANQEPPVWHAINSSFGRSIFAETTRRCWIKCFAFRIIAVDLSKVRFSMNLVGWSENISAKELDCHDDRDRKFRQNSLIVS